MDPGNGKKANISKKMTYPLPVRIRRHVYMAIGISIDIYMSYALRSHSDPISYPQYSSGVIPNNAPPIIYP